MTVPSYLRLLTYGRKDKCWCMIPLRQRRSTCSCPFPCNGGRGMVWLIAITPTHKHTHTYYPYPPYGPLRRNWDSSLWSPPTTPEGFPAGCSTAPGGMPFSSHHSVKKGCCLSEEMVGKPLTGRDQRWIQALLTFPSPSKLWWTHYPSWRFPNFSPILIFQRHDSHQTAHISECSAKFPCSGQGGSRRYLPWLQWNSIWTK